MADDSRRTRLLAAISAEGGVWTTRRVQDMYRLLGIRQRKTARDDLKALHRAGFLAVGGPDNGRFYRLSVKGVTT